MYVDTNADDGCRGAMIPAGYMAKRIVSQPEWLGSSRVLDVYSVSSHVSCDFADYIKYWRHNGFWLFDSPKIIRQIAEAHSLDLTGMKFFYYEVYELEFDEKADRWTSFQLSQFETNVVEPRTKHLEGYDVVAFFAHSRPECSPLSCNSLAVDIETNAHCLFVSLEDAIQSLEHGEFRYAEPGPYRVFSVYSLGRTIPSVRR